MPDEQNPSVVSLRSEAFGNVPNPSAPFRSVPNSSEAFGTVRNASEKKENHILTVREVARLFEGHGVTRTERSITNWCQSSKSGVARLDANDRKYFITPQSVDAAIKEELAKAAKHADASQAYGNVPNHSESGNGRDRVQGEDTEEAGELRFKLRESEIASRVKEDIIKHLKEQNDRLEARNEHMVEQLVNQSRTLGQLESKLLQLEGPKPEPNDPRRIQVVSEREKSLSE